MKRANSLSVRVATLLGLGYSPIAPGTLGTLAAVPVVWAMQFLPWQQQLILVLVLIPPATWICHRAAQHMKSRDPGAIVLDETIGFMLAGIALPGGIYWMLAAFVLFRFLDIAKPWPIGAVEARLHGGIGIMADDLVAAALAWLAIWLAYGLVGG